MKFVIESGESILTIHREDQAIIMDVNGQKIAIQGADLEDFKNLVGNMWLGVVQKKEEETPLIKKIEILWKGLA
jgi:hypothetical protein